MVFIFDANSHFARVYMAATKEGMPSIRYREQAVFALQPLRQLIEKEIRTVESLGYQFSHIVMVFDAAGPCFRHDICDEYKSNRKKKEPEYKQQLDLAVKMFETLGYPCLQVPGVEADDVMATLSIKLTARAIPHVIFSGDKDLLCLINQYSQQYAGKAGILYDQQAVVDKLELQPHQLLDYLTIVGDAADNIKGIDGIGHKVRCLSCNHYTLDQVLDDPHVLRRLRLRNINHLVRYIRDNQTQILKSRALVSLKTDVELNINLNQLVKRQATTMNFLPHIVNLATA